jgi:branched-chain amino acid transport system ATP-binding protein
MTELLKTINLSKNFGGLAAVEKVNLSIGEGEKTVGIIGPNGSGKTTFFNMLTGFCLPSAGQVIFREEDITRHSPNRRVLQGIARTFQLVSVFDRLTPWENLVLSSIRFEKKNQSLSKFMLKSARNKETLDTCFEMLSLMGLEKVAAARTSELSYGSKRMLEIGIALSLKPRLLLLDEPLAGLSDFEIVEVVAVLKKIKSQLNLIIIEHKLSKILELVDRFVVLNEGKVICEGDPAQVLSDEAVRECYWGKSEIAGGAA